MFKGNSEEYRFQYGEEPDYIDRDYGPIHVHIIAAGEGVPPWNEQGGARFEFEVVVTDKHGNEYTTKAWGSTHDYEKGIVNFSLGCMVIDELLSAMVDPDEFIELVIGELKGREALKRGKEAETIVKQASHFDQDDLQAAVDECERLGLR